MQELGLFGNLYVSNPEGEKPAILILSGSDGGIPGTNAIPESFLEYLASHGFVILALAYFGIEGLPDTLENIPLEYFEKAVQWLKSQFFVDASLLGVLGQSRGAELSLVLGSLFPKMFQAICAIAPCNMAIGGFPHPNEPAWIYQKTPLPFLSGFSSDEKTLTESDDLKIAIQNQEIPLRANPEEDPCIIADLFIARQKKKDAKNAEIPVENIKCPLLLLSGDQDAIWPSSFYCEAILEKLKNCSNPKHIRFPEAGHGILVSYDGPIYHPKGNFWCKLGGTPEGNAPGNTQSWKIILEFFQNTLEKHETL